MYCFCSGCLQIPRWIKTNLSNFSCQMMGNFNKCLYLLCSSVFTIICADTSSKLALYLQQLSRYEKQSGLCFAIVVFSMLAVHSNSLFTSKLNVLLALISPLLTNIFLSVLWKRYWLYWDSYYLRWTYHAMLLLIVFSVC